MISNKIFKLKSIFLILALISGCFYNKESDINQLCQRAKFPCYKDKAIVEMQTSKGTLIIEINGNLAPITSGNFIDLVNKGFYNKGVFYKVIKQPQPYLVQAKGIGSKQSKTMNFDSHDSNYVDPSTGQARFIPLEIKVKNEILPRYNQIIVRTNDLTKLELIHKRGSIAMARSQSLNSANSQFYIALKNLPELDGRFTVFGRVLNGMNVLDKLNQGDLIINLKVIKKDLK